MKLRTGDPWMPARQYAHGLRGLTVNLLVQDVERAIAFQRGVLGAEVIYGDPDFACLRYDDAEWLLHADHAYDSHPLHPRLTDGSYRGLGA